MVLYGALMKNKDYLFHLIKAMSKSEKRYFTLDAQKSGRKDSKYLELFQAINGMTEYDETKLKKKFPKNLASDKGYLYEAILRSMRDYRSAKSRTAQIKQMVLDSKYLYERGLYKQSEARLGEAQEMARQLDDQFSLLEINKEKLNLAWETKKQNFDKKITQLIGQKDYNIGAINEELKYLDICYALSSKFFEQKELEAHEDKVALSKQFPADLFDEQCIPQSEQAQRRFYQSKAVYYQLLGDFDQMYYNYRKVVDWWEANPLLKEEEFYRYIKDVSNLLHACSTKGHFELIPDLTEQLQKDQPSNAHDQNVIFQKVAMYSLLYHINLGVAEGADKRIEEIEKGLQEHKLSPVTRLIITVNTSILQFILENYDDCQVWIQKVLKEFKQTAPRDIQVGSRLLYLFTILEKDDIAQTDATIRSVQRQLNQKEGLECFQL